MSRQCFVIMPICKEGTDEYAHFRDVYEHMIKPSVEGCGLDFNCIRADEVSQSGSIIKDILSKLKSSDVVIADLTGRNPNVFYELGVRHSLSKRTILIAQSIEDVPFDLQAYRVIEYTPNLPGADRFKKQIEKYLKDIIAKPESADNPIQDFLKVEKSLIIYENPFAGPGYEKWRELVFDVLTQIAPPSDEFDQSEWTDLDSVYEIGRKAYGESKWVIGAISSIIKILDLFGTLKIKKRNHVVVIQPISKIARYLIRSLAFYFKEDLKVFRSWGREGVYQDLSEDLLARSGPYFLKALESRRLRESQEQIPLREVKVAFGLIKAISEKNEEVFLFMFDEPANQYQPIGGRLRPEDEDLLETLVREVEEELSAVDVSYERGDFKYQRLLDKVEQIEISPTYGVSTYYHIEVYQVFFEKLPLLISPSHKWVKKEEIYSGKTEDDYKVAMSYLEELEKAIDGGLGGLPPSCSLY